MTSLTPDQPLYVISCLRTEPMFNNPNKGWLSPIQLFGHTYDLNEALQIAQDSAVIMRDLQSDVFRMNNRCEFSQSSPYIIEDFSKIKEKPVDKQQTVLHLVIYKPINGQFKGDELDIYHIYVQIIDHKNIWNRLS